MRLYRKWIKFALRLLLTFLLTITITRLLRWSININKNRLPEVYGNRTQILMQLERLLQDLVIQEKGTGCEFSDHTDQSSIEVVMYDEDVEEFVCDSDDWVQCNFSECYVEAEVLDWIQNITCTYKDIVYVNDDVYYLGDAVQVKGNNKYRLNVSDYVRVSCTGVEPYVVSWWRRQWHGRKAGYRRLPTVAVRDESLNVFVLIVNSISENSFIRRMPLSYYVLMNELGAIVMDGYNIVGHGIDGALWPILTGHNELEVSDSRKRPGNTKRVDPKPFLFTLLNEYGYRTAYLEDIAYSNTFNNRFNGFERMPADHYMRHLFQDIGLQDRSTSAGNDRYCIGSKSVFEFIMNYSADLFKMGVKMFCVTQIATFNDDDDEELARFLKIFKYDERLDDTMLLVIADHGTKTPDIRNSYQGRIKELLPFMSIVLPERLKKTRPDALHNLMGNSKVLTTPYDIHTTILDALDLRKLRNKYKVPGADLERGMSFLKPIPKSRSCAEAGIVPHLCACMRRQNVSTYSVVSMKVARKLAHYINGVTKKVRHKCAERNLISIEWVYRLGPKITTEETFINKYYSERYRDENHLQMNEYYQVKVMMDPGEDIFEGIVKYNVEKDYFSISDSDVTRVYKNRDNPICVGGHVDKYCYCIADY